jgi:hypothetical protein
MLATLPKFAQWAFLAVATVFTLTIAVGLAASILPIV